MKKNENWSISQWGYLDSKYFSGVCGFNVYYASRLVFPSNYFKFSLININNPKGLQFDLHRNTLLDTTERKKLINDKAKLEFTAMIESDDRLLMVLDTTEGVKGLFGAVAFGALCGQAVATYEQYIWIDEDHRTGYAMRRFMRGYERWGEALGAVMQFMVSHNEHEKLQRFYSLFGYAPSDRVYIRKT